MTFLSASIVVNFCLWMDGRIATSPFTVYHVFELHYNSIFLRIRLHGALTFRMASPDCVAGCGTSLSVNSISSLQSSLYQSNGILCSRSRWPYLWWKICCVYRRLQPHSSRWRLLSLLLFSHSRLLPQNVHDPTASEWWNDDNSRMRLNECDVVV